MGVLKFLFILTLVTFPLGQIARLQLSGDINVTLFDASVLTTSIVWLLYTLGKRKKTTAALTKPILFFAGAIVISLIANLFRYSGAELFVASLYGTRWVLFACLYFVAQEFDGQFRKKLPTLLTVAGSVILGFGYIQYAFYQNLRNLYYLGWDDHLYRMFSTFLDPNFAGAFFVLFFIFLAGNFYEFYSSSQARSAKRNSSHFVRTILLGILCILTFIAIFLTTSRSAFIMLTVGLFTYLILIEKKKWMLLFIAIVVIVYLIASRFFYLENVNPFRTASSTARIEAAENAIDIIEKNPIFGIGFNAYRYAQYRAGFRTPEAPFPSHADSGTDNSFLFVFATTGIIGLTAFLYLLVAIIKLGRKKEHTIMGKILVASIIGLVVNSFFINSLFYPMILFWVWVIAGLTDYT